ncbi:MAG: hypothetical protein M3Y59_00480 [Myxococcota bacterium]|nr:hypothetical protein [Myxococcota bacterium]
MTKLQQVDGAGSGLDADRLGGVASAQYSRSRVGSIPLNAHGMRISGGASMLDRGATMSSNTAYLGYAVVLPEDFETGGTVSLRVWWKTNDATACSYAVSKGNCLQLGGPALSVCTWTADDGSFNVSSAGGDGSTDGFLQKTYQIGPSAGTSLAPGHRIEIIFTRGTGTCSQGVQLVGGDFSYPRR